MNHPFNDEHSKKRLLWEYRNYPSLIVGIDFDNTIRPVKGKASCDEVIDLLRQCSKDPKVVLCLWSICGSDEEVRDKVLYCESLGIDIDYVNESPFKIDGKEDNPKQFFNVLLDDRAGLESAYNNLKYVMDHVSD